MKTICNLQDGLVETVELSPEESAEFEALIAEHAIQQTDLANTEYQRQRAAEYPPVTDYLDGIVKGDQAQVQAYIDACLAVKAKYPKPA